MADQKADTYGWDTVFGIRVDDVNAAIARANSSPTTFHAAGKDTLSGITFTIDGAFGDWRITRGGSGALVHMMTPVTQMNVQGGAKNFPFSDGLFVIEVRLHYLPHTEQPEDETKGAFHNLLVKTTTDDPANRPVVTIISSHFPQEDYGDLKVDVENALDDWFNANLKDFTHIFATVNLNRTADKGQFQWLLPTYTSYAYIDGPTDDASILGILCMTENRIADGLVEEISPNVIPQGSRSGFLISRERFLSQTLLPSMPYAFKGSSVNDYQLASDNNSLTLKDNQPIDLQNVQHDGKSYSPTLQSLTISTTNERLTIDTTTKVEVSWQIWSYCHSTYSYKIVLHNQQNGSQALYYQQIGDPVKEDWTEKGEGVVITEVIAGIIAALATLILGIVTGGAGFVVGALVIGLLVGVAEEIPNIIAAANTDDAPPIDMLVFNCVDPLQWADQKDFTLDFAGLNDSLQLGGTPHFDEIDEQSLHSQTGKVTEESNGK